MIMTKKLSDEKFGRFKTTKFFSLKAKKLTEEKNAPMSMIDFLNDFKKDFSNSEKPKQILKSKTDALFIDKAQNLISNKHNIFEDRKLEYFVKLQKTEANLQKIDNNVLKKSSLILKNITNRTSKIPELKNNDLRKQIYSSKTLHWTKIKTKRNANFKS